MAKIVCTVTNDLSYDQRMIRICTSLQDLGHEVLLVGRTRPGSVALVYRAFQQKRLYCIFSKGKLFYLEYNIRLFFFLLFHSFEIVCSVDLDTILPGYWISKMRNKVCVYDAHEYFTEVPEVVRRPGVKRVWEWVANRTIPKLNYCYTVGQSLAKIFEERYGPSFEVIRNVPFSMNEGMEGRKESYAMINPDHNKVILLYQGVLNEGRGIEQVIQAISTIDQVELWLAGEGDLSKELRALVQQLKLEQSVKFLGYLQPEELKKITPQAAIGLNLIENKGLSYYYSLANKAFDYIQAGIPSINMAYPEYEKINEEIEVFYLAKNLDVNELQTLISSILEDQETYNRLCENTRIAARGYTWEREVEKLKAFYEKIISSM